MAFTVSDFEDLMTGLRANAEWLDRLRQLLVDEFWQPLRDEVRALSESVRAGQEEMRAGFARVDARFERVEADIGVLKTDVAVLKTDVAALKTDVAVLKTDVAVLKTDVAVLKTDVGQLKTDVGHLKGSDLERSFREKAPGFFGQTMGRCVVVQPGNLDKMRQASRDGLLSDDEWTQVMSLDALVRGRSDDGEERYVAVEVSAVIDGGDVRRASERSAILNRVGYRTTPAVVGKTITERAAADAKAGDVLVRTGFG